jgi:acyl-CoA synthetase (AMP-forming)/AMP-acid ligase II
MNIATLLEMLADTFPERVALTCDGESWTYRELLGAARALALELRESGARSCGYLALASPAAPVALFASALAGVPYVPLNYRLTPQEITALLARIDPALLIVDPAYRADAARVEDRATLLQRLRNVEVDWLEPADASVAVQLFTSGTTGKPKAAILRHENLFSYIVGTVEFASAEEDEAALVTVPPYHIAAVSAMLSSVYAGRRMVQLPNFEAGEWIRLCREENVTSAFVVPTMLSRIVAVLEEQRSALPRLRSIAYGGGRMPLATISRAMQLLPHVAFTNAYGLTETSSTIALLGPEDHRAASESEDPLIRRRLVSVGRALPTVEIAVRDEAGAHVDADVIGRVLVRGAQVSGEYDGLGALTDSEGWFDTRDRGFLDAEGYLFLDGRADDVIVRGGENISPGEVEEVLLGHPHVSDVAVVAIADDAWGEAVAAAIVLHKPVAADELQEWVRTRLRSSRVPQAIRFVDALPYNELGKLLRRVVRDDFNR